MALLKERSIKTLLTDLKDWFALKAKTVFSVNGHEPVDGAVSFDTIPFADNLTSDETQHTEGSFLARTTGGEISLSDGDSFVQRILGNRVHEGYVAEVLTPTVIAMPRPTPAAITATLNETTFEEYVGEAGTYTLSFTGGDWSADPALYGVTVTNDPVNGDQIVITWDGENAAEMTVNAVEREPAPEITVTIDRDVFVAYVSESGTTLLTYTTGWSADPALYGVTVANDPLAGDQIRIVYVKEDRGTITQAALTALVATGWNLYNPLTGYARTPKYSETYGYRIGGTYTGISFAETPTGSTEEITVTNGLFNVPSDGYVLVQGGDATTYIYTTWSDWQEGYQGDFESYTESVLDLTAIMTARFPHGLMRVGDVRDEINLNTGRAISRIERMLYTAENIASLGGREYEADSTYVYAVRTAEVINNISLDEKMTVNEHGIEFFRDSAVDVYAEILYGSNLKDKLRRQVVAATPQSFTAGQQAQARSNIGAASTADITALSGNIANLQDGLAIVADGDTHAAIESGQFVYVKNHSSLAEGLYRASSAIGTNAALSTSNLTADSSGGMNDLQSQVTSLNSNLRNMDFPKKSTGSYTALFASVGTQLDANRIFVYISFPFTLNTVNYNISITACTILGVSSIDVSTITVDNKRVNGVRLAIAKTGTVRDSYCIEISATISY